MKSCSQCSAELRDSDLQCPACGLSIDGVSAETAVLPADPQGKTPTRLSNPSKRRDDPFVRVWLEYPRSNWPSRDRHSGGYQGFESQISRYPDHDLSVILFSNLRGDNVGVMVHQIAELVRPDLKPKDREPATTAAHRRLFQVMIDGTADRSLFTPEAAATIFPLVERTRDEMKSFGAIENIELLNRKTEGSLRTNIYRLTFKTQKAMYIVILKDGKITIMDLRPE